jgi:acylphosphatase
MKPTAQQRREVFYRGRVQGVGFRYTTCSIAARFNVTGFVMNLPDGAVQLVAEGAPQELDAFLQDVENSLGRYIQSSTRDALPASGGFDDFEIRRY